MNTSFSIAEAVSFGWQRTRTYSGLVFKFMLTLVAISLLQSFFSAASRTIPSAGILSFLLSLFSVVLSVGITIIILKIAKNEQASYGDIIPPWNLGWRYVLVSLIVAVLVVLSFAIPIGIGVLILFMKLGIIGSVVGAICIAAGIILGAYIAMQYFMLRFVAVDGVHSIGDILRRSRTLTHGVKWHLLLFVLCILVLNIFGLICLIVGILITIPVSGIASGYIYLKLCERTPLAVAQN